MSRHGAVGQGLGIGITTGDGASTSSSGNSGAASSDEHVLDDVDQFHGITFQCVYESGVAATRSLLPTVFTIDSVAGC